jgi:hypothetical protein
MFAKDVEKNISSTQGRKKGKRKKPVEKVSNERKRSELS